MRFNFVSFLVFIQNFLNCFGALYCLNIFEDNDMDALTAMMYFVQDWEPSSFNDVVGE